MVGNINAAFVDLGGGRTGYYSLDENRSICLSPPSRKLKAGDEIVVQVSRDAVKQRRRS